MKSQFNFTFSIFFLLIFKNFRNLIRTYPHQVHMEPHSHDDMMLNFPSFAHFSDVNLVTNNKPFQQQHEDTSLKILKYLNFLIYLHKAFYCLL